MTLLFFFQAEDGIRDWSVTGVQTCALPIYGGGHVERDALIGSALLILVAAAANQGVGKTGLGGVPPNREKEGEGSAVGRIGKVEALAEAAGQSNVNA